MRVWRETPKHNTFSLFIKRVGPETIEELFNDLASQAFRMGIIDPLEAVKASVDTFMKAYSRRGRKGGLSDRGARVRRRAFLVSERAKLKTKIRGVLAYEGLKPPESVGLFTRKGVD